MGLPTNNLLDSEIKHWLDVASGMASFNQSEWIIAE